MYLVDTNIVSEARRGTLPAVTWLSSVAPESIDLSVVTIGEIERGIRNKHVRDGRPPTQLVLWLDLLRNGFADRILPIDMPVARAWGQMSALKRRPDADGFIAATALIHNLTLVTRNIADFEQAGIELIDPWSAV